MNIDKHLFPISSEISSSGTFIDGSVAILMRTKDRPILLARALQSVIQQKYHNWHLYLINDGGDKNVVDDLLTINESKLNNRITVIHNKESLGMEAASNCGFNLANEEFVVVHDDDDAWNPDFLAETVSYLKRHSSAVAVLTNCFVVHEKIQDDEVHQLDIFGWRDWKDSIDILDLIKGNITPPICLLIRMRVAKAIGSFNQELPVLGDWDYNLRLFRAGNIETLNKKLAFYHQRPASSNIYGNSIISGIDKHQKYLIEYRNSLVREALLSNQGNFGLLHSIIFEFSRRNQEIVGWLSHLDGKLNQLDDKLNHLDGKLNHLDGKLNHLDGKLNHLDGKLNQLDDKLNQALPILYMLRKFLRPFQVIWKIGKKFKPK